MTNAEHRTGVWPLVPYSQHRAGIDFLVRAFGFEESLTVPDEDGGIAHAELRWPLGGGIMLGTTDPDNPFSKPAGSAALYLLTDDPDGLFARARDSGAETVREPTDQGYGSRDFAVHDPEGNTWCFGTYAGG